MRISARCNGLWQNKVSRLDRTDAVPGIPRALLFKDPNGLVIELFAEWRFLRSIRPPSGIAPLNLGHVAFAIQDPAAMANFYENILGFRTSDWMGDYFVFLRCNPDHHTVNFIRGDSFHLRHFAFELRDMAHVQTACDILGERRIPVMAGPLRHGPGRDVAVCHRNSADQVVEVYIEMDQMKTRKARLFRAAALASRPSTAPEGFGIPTTGLQSSGVSASRRTVDLFGSIPSFGPQIGRRAQYRAHCGRPQGKPS